MVFTFEELVVSCPVVDLPDTLSVEKLRIVLFLIGLRLVKPPFLFVETPVAEDPRLAVEISVEVGLAVEDK